MIVWCSYCQRFVHESPPWEEFQITHGICPDCAGREDPFGGDLLGARAIGRFLESNARGILAGRIPDSATTVEKARALGIRPADLLLSLLQPVLCEVGRQFEADEITVATEHRISAFVEEVLGRLDESRTDRGRADFLLTTVPGNRHGLGLRVLAEILAEQGHEVELLSDQTEEAILERLSAGEHRWLGISVALPSHLPVARALALSARRVSPKTRIAAGGWAFKSPEASRSLPELDIVVDAQAVADLRWGSWPFT